MNKHSFECPFAKGVFFVGTLILAASLPLSKVGMSVGQFTMVAGWIFEGRYLARFRDLTRNRVALLLISLYLLHVLGVGWTTDLSWALKDLRTKLPLFALPVLFATGPHLSRKALTAVLVAFLGGVLAASLISTGRLVFLDIADPRKLFPYISHIRFSLEVCLAIAVSVVFVIAGKTGRQKRVALALAVWFFLFLFILRAFTGMLIFTVVAYFAVAHAVMHSRKRAHRRNWAIIMALMLITGAAGGWLLNDRLTPPDIPALASLPGYTASGNPYSHNVEDRQSVNGHHIWLYVCEEELKEAWEGRSTLPYDHVDEEGWDLSNVLIRYMTSKGLRKDAEGFASLSEDDILAVESGSTYPGSGIPAKIMERINDIHRSLEYYRQSGDASGNSLTQRLELWRTGWNLFKGNWIAGVGTGDIRPDFAAQLELDGSSMAGSPLRTHNQMLTFAATFGFFGFLWALLSLVWPLIRFRKWNSILYTLFFLIIFLSFFTEDTLETQAGATLFAFFNSLLLFYKADPAEPAGRQAEGPGK